jgi:CheY-like chemotaxis protein
VVKSRRAGSDREEERFRHGCLQSRRYDMSSATPSNKTVLIIEDDLLIRGAMKMLLEWEGYRVDCAGNGEEGLHRLRSTALPSVILLDLMMPGLDGWQFLAERRQDPTLAAIPVIVVSALKEADNPWTAEYIQKPFQPPELLEAVRRHG